MRDLVDEIAFKIKADFICASDRTWTGNLFRALIQYFHKGVDYIFTMSFRF